MGFKLKIGLLDFITAENVSWQKEELAVDQLYFGGSWPPFRPTGEEKYSSVEKVKELYQDPQILAQERQLAAEWQQRAPKDQFPLIITEKKWGDKTGLVVYDGNARLNQAVIDAKEKVVAWVGRLTDQSFQPRNFWVPTTLLMELVVRARHFWREQCQQEFKQLVTTIKLVVADSQSGFYELKHRAIWGPKEFQQEFWYWYRREERAS